MPLKVLILGANGFIGSSLTRAILKQKDWEVYGMDVGDHKLTECLGHPRSIEMRAAQQKHVQPVIIFSETRSSSVIAEQTFP